MTDSGRYRMLVDNRELSEPERLAMLREDETAFERTPAHVYADPITTVEALLNQGATAKVLRLTPDQWRAMSPHEQRGLIRHTEQRLKALSERYAFMKRHGPAELEIPEFLRVRGAV